MEPTIQSSRPLRMNSGDLSIDINNIKKGNLGGLDVDMGQNFTRVD